MDLDSEFDDFFDGDLQNAQPLPLPVPVVETKDRDAVATNLTVQLPHFERGVIVEFKGKRCTVDYTVIRDQQLRVKLREEERDVCAAEINAPLKTYDLTRR